MKRSYGKYLISAAIPMIVAVLPGVSFATCTNGVPNGPATWDSSVIVPRTASIGAGSDIGPNVKIGGYVNIDKCNAVGMDGNGGQVSYKASLGFKVTMKNDAWIGMYTSVGNFASIDGSSLGQYVKIADSQWNAMTAIRGGSTVGAHTRIGPHAILWKSGTGQYVSIGANSKIVNSFLGYRSNYGDNVTVNSGTYIGQYATVDSGVNIGSNVTIGQHAHICVNIADNMTIRAYDKIGCN